MLNIEDDGASLRLVERLGTGRRVALGLVALVPLLAPYELIVRPRWTSLLSPAFVFCAVIALGAMVLSALFASAAVAGTDAELELQRDARTFAYTTYAPLVRRRTATGRLEELTGIHVERDDSGESGPSWTLVACATNGRRMRMGAARSQEAADEIARRVAVLLSESASGRAPG